MSVHDVYLRGISSFLTVYLIHCICFAEMMTLSDVSSVLCLVLLFPLCRVRQPPPHRDLECLGSFRATTSAVETNNHGNEV